MRDPTMLGQIESASGATITVALDSETLSGLVYIAGQSHRVGQIGSFVRIPQGFTSLFGIVTQAGAAAAPSQPLAAESSRRWLTVEIVGEGRPGQPFSRGVYRYPTIGDKVHLVTEEDLSVVYGSATSVQHVEIGSLSSARSIPARIDINRLVARHSAVVGATGSGKSTTVAGILNKIADEARFPSARVIMLDIHGEYASAFKERARVFRVGAESQAGERPLIIPYWALTFEELVVLAFGSVDDAGRGRLADWVLQEKRSLAATGRFGDLPPEWITVDTALPFSLKKLWYDFRWEIDATYPRGAEQTRERACLVDPGSVQELVAARFQPNDGANVVQSRSTLAFRKQLEILASKLRDPRLNFLFDPAGLVPGIDNNVDSDVDELLGAWLGSSIDAPEPISILDLSGVPASILVDLVGAMLRILFDALFWGRKLSEGARERPLLVVMEEAHVYLSEKESAASIAVKRIAKEGRKYGIGAMIVSQRPTEIDSTILSQCGTFFALRMGNSLDRASVAASTTDSLKGLLDLLPTLRTGEAIVVGEAVHIPTRAMIHPPPEGRRPNSDDPRVVETDFPVGEGGPGGWDKQLEALRYSDLVLAWRRQDTKSPRSVP